MKKSTKFWFEYHSADIMAVVTIVLVATMVGAAAKKLGASHWCLYPVGFMAGCAFIYGANRLVRFIFRKRIEQNQCFHGHQDGGKSTVVTEQMTGDGGKTFICQLCNKRWHI